MTISAFDGPVVTFPNSNTTGLTQSNPEGGPSMFAHSRGILDLRRQFTYIPGQNFGKATLGWISHQAQVLSQVPYTATVNNIAAAQTATSGTAMTLVSASATGITAGVSSVRADTGATVTGLLAIDSAMTTIAYGSAGTIQAWSPDQAISRNIRISCNGTDTTGAYIVRGYDIYGFPLTESIAGGAGTAVTAVVVSGSKAFKYVASVTPTGTVNSTGATVGTGDTIGLPLRADRWTELSIWQGNTAIAVGTGFTAAITSAATQSTGDVRGTYALQTASNGVDRLVINQRPLPANISTTAGLTGVNQYSS